MSILRSAQSGALSPPPVKLQCRPLHCGGWTPTRRPSVAAAFVGAADRAEGYRGLGLPTTTPAPRGSLSFIRSPEGLGCLFFLRDISTAVLTLSNTLTTLECITACQPQHQEMHCRWIDPRFTLRQRINHLRLNESTKKQGRTATCTICNNLSLPLPAHVRPWPQHHYNHHHHHTPHTGRPHHGGMLSTGCGTPYASLFTFCNTPIFSNQASNVALNSSLFS